MVPLTYYIVLSVTLFSTGVLGVLTSKNAIKILMCVEIMLNAANVNFVAFSVYNDNVSGQIFAIFIIALAAAEAAVGLAIFMLLYRNRGTINVYEIKDLRW